jgi:hypothetical protein
MMTPKANARAKPRTKSSWAGMQSIRCSRARERRGIIGGLRQQLSELIAGLEDSWLGGTRPTAPFECACLREWRTCYFFKMHRRLTVNVPIAPPRPMENAALT